MLKKRFLSLGLCFLLVGQGVLQNAFTSLAETNIAVYMTTTPENRVGDTINVNYASVDLTSSFLSDVNVTWYRSSVGDYNGDVISDVTGNSYQLTESDVGYHVYAEVSVADSELIYRTDISKVVKSEDASEDAKTWIVEGNWEYAIREDGTAEIRLKRKNADDSAFKLGSLSSVENVEIPSNIAGLEVTKIADDCFLNCHELYSKTSYSTVYVTSIPSTVKEIGSRFIIYSHSPSSSVDDIKFVIPETVESIEVDSVIRHTTYAYNDGYSVIPSIRKLVFENPTIHINGGMMQTARNLISTDVGLVVYSGAKGSTAENMYVNELKAWSDAGLSSPDCDVYKWEKSGVYAPDSGLVLTPAEQFQQKLNNNQVDYVTSTDRSDLDKDVVDGTDKLIVKPNEVIDNSFIIIPPELDGQTVGALELDTTGKKNVVVEIPDGVIIDSNSKVDSSTIISGNSGSQAEEFAKDNNLIFENKDNEITSKEEVDAAKRSQEMTSSDGYWKYSFIDGYNGVEIQNIKSFGVNATVEVPETIDGHKTSVFKGNRPKQADVKYASIVLPEGIHVVNGDIRSEHSYDLGYSKGTTNLTVMDKNADVSSLTKSYAPSTITGWRGSTAEAICTPMASNIGSTFIALDLVSDILVEITNASGAVGTELFSSLEPSDATGSYQWQIADMENGSYTTISGATSSTYIPKDEDINKFIKVVFTGSGSYDGQTVSSNIIQIIGESVPDNPETPPVNQCNVEVTQGQSFVVKIPAFVSLEGEKGKVNSASFVTGLTADIAGTDSITIKPSVETVVMKESGGIKKDIEAILTMSRTEFGFDNYTQTDFEMGIEETHSIEVKKLTAGKWTGTINWIIETKGEVIPDSVEYVEYKSYQSTVDGLVEVK